MILTRHVTHITYITPITYSLHSSYNLYNSYILYSSCNLYNSNNLLKSYTKANFLKLKKTSKIFFIYFFVYQNTK